MLMHRKPLPVTRCDAAAATAADARRVSVPSKLLLVLQSATHWTRPDHGSTGEVWLLQSSSMWNENQPPSVMFLGGREEGVTNGCEKLLVATTAFGSLQSISGGDIERLCVGN